MQQLQKKLDAVCSQKINPKRSPTKLFEVFCGPNSRLANQVTKLGHQAVRFALPQIDLMTEDGQTELFRQLELISQSICGLRPYVALGQPGLI